MWEANYKNGPKFSGTPTLPETVRSVPSIPDNKSYALPKSRSEINLNIFDVHAPTPKTYMWGVAFISEPVHCSHI